MEFYLLLVNIAATIFMLLGSIFHLVYGKIKDRENKIIASPPSLICQSPIQASSSLSHSPPSSPPRSWEHDVFPSFHGPDVRKGFLSHIQKEFERTGITSFIDNNIKRGESIAPELKRAIQRSKIAVVLLSKNYASSSWCLDELVEIMSKVVGQTVLTIFYDVEPTDVKKQTGDFGKVFNFFCRGKTKEKTETWRKALEAVATIAGYHSSNWVDEATMIKNIAADISKILNSLAPSPDLDRFIGMGAHMEKMQQLLRLDLDEVRMIGIWGLPGIGKSTIARFMFNQLSNNFQFRAIMVNIKGNYPRPCLDEYSAQLQLQNQMLSQMINHKDTMITHLGVAQERLKDKNVLLVLDDVDRLAQLDALAKKVQWFGPRSRVIITTEDLELFKAHGINQIYKVKFPSNDEALQMFCMYAFGQKSPEDGFTNICHEITHLVGRLPLGLKVMGSYFRGKPKQKWTRALPKLWSCLNGEIESILKFSYDALCYEDQDLFLHIACYFNHEKIEKVEEHLANKFFDVREGLQFLVDKSLISISCEQIEMHSLLAQLGKGIVRKQSNRKPGKRQFLFESKDIGEVFTDPTAKSKRVIGICSSDYLNLDKLNISEKAFEGMYNLQFLKLISGFHGPTSIASLLGGMKYISPKLQVLDWRYSPMTSLPFIVNLEFLGELIMPHSKLEKLWEGIKLLGNLKWMDLNDSKNLKELPNLSTATNLQKLDIRECSSLVKLPSSIGNATNLQTLNLSKCSSLMGIPSSIGNLHRLRWLNMSGCSKLEVLPTNINLESLINLDLTNCSSLKSFPEISTNIEVLKLSGTAIEEVPSSISSWSRLKELHMSYCEILQVSPHARDNVTELHFNKTEIQELGPWVKEFSRLRRLVLNEMQKLVSLSQLPDCLMDLDANNCVSLERLDCSFRNPDILLDFQNCFKLNQEARDLIIRTSTSRYLILPGREVPACFTYRASGSSVTVKLNEKPLPASTKFKVCILVLSQFELYRGEFFGVKCIITSKHNALISRRSDKTLYITENISEQLYIFEVETEEMPSSTELVFEFKTDSVWKILECGILQLL